MCEHVLETDDNPSVTNAPGIVINSARSIVTKLCSMQSNFLANLRSTLSLLCNTEFSNYDAASRPRLVQRLRRAYRTSFNENLYKLVLLKADVVNVLLEVSDMLVTW